MKGNFMSLVVGALVLIFSVGFVVVMAISEWSSDAAKPGASHPSPEPLPGKPAKAKKKAPSKAKAKKKKK
jgi:hypothetical protein